MADRAVLDWSSRQTTRWTVKDVEVALNQRYCIRMVRKVVTAGVAAGVYLCAPCKRGNELLFERHGLPQARPWGRTSG